MAKPDGKARIVVVEDHTLVRQSLVKTLNAKWDVVGEAGNVNEGWDAVMRDRPDMVMLDVAMPGGDGLTLAERIKTELPETKVLILSMHEDDSTISRALNVGVDGYVAKTAPTEELLTAIDTVLDGDPYLSPTIARRVMSMAGRPGGSHPSDLTARELEILAKLASGSRTAEVAADLHLSVKTVKNHLTSIYSKLHVESGTQAVAEAYRRGLVSVDPPTSP